MKYFQGIANPVDGTVPMKWSPKGRKRHDSDVIATIGNHPEFIKAARRLGWIAPDAVRMTKSDALAVTYIPANVTSQLGEPVYWDVDTETWRFTDDGQWCPGVKANLSFFSDCINLGVLSNFRNIAYIEPFAFIYCNLLTYISIFISNIKCIYAHTFDGCSSLEYIAIPPTVHRIYHNAFDSCFALSLSNIDFVTKIDEGAFASCESLTKIRLSKKLETISSLAFYGCKNLTEVENSQYALRIEADAFLGCRNLEQLNMSKDLEYLGDRAFAGCEKLQFFAVPMYLTSIPEGAFERAGLINIAWNYWADNLEYVESIGDEAFQSCPLNSPDFRLPSKLKRLGNYAFKSSKMSVVTIPKTIEYIGAGVFEDCAFLKRVFIEAETPPELVHYHDTFPTQNTGFRIYVPASSLSAYKTAQNWDEIADSIFPIAYGD